MRIRLVAMGQRMPAWVDAGVADYVQRLPREYRFAVVELKPAARDRGRTSAQLLAEERLRFEAATAGAQLIALDEQGSAWTTRTFAGHLARWREEQADLAFLIGSADGLDPGLKAAAQSRLALSALTLPHALCRVILVEQLYRAASLAAGHPYHRE